MYLPESLRAQCFHPNYLLFLFMLCYFVMFMVLKWGTDYNLFLKAKPPWSKFPNKADVVSSNLIPRRHHMRISPQGYTLHCSAKFSDVSLNINKIIGIIEIGNDRGGTIPGSLGEQSQWLQKARISEQGRTIFHIKTSALLYEVQVSPRVGYC